MTDETHQHAVAHAHADSADTDITSAEISEAFVPALVAAAAMAVVDSEAVILDEEAGSTHLLNATGSLVVQCFDGESTLAEIAADVAEAFRAPLELVSEDILTLCRELGDAGMLQGVSSLSRQRERITSGPSSTTSRHVTPMAGRSTTSGSLRRRRCWSTGVATAASARASSGSSVSWRRR
jgi:hypothetical protein